MLERIDAFFEKHKNVILVPFGVVAVVSAASLYVVLANAIDDSSNEDQNNACQASQPPSCVGPSEAIVDMRTRSYWLCACPCDGGESVIHQAPRD